MFIPRTEKKWYSTYDSKPQGEWDRVAELMMIKFGESGHPVFRATSPLSRGTLKSKGGGKIINALLCRWWCDWNCFSHKFFCQSGQYPRSSLRFVWRIQSLPCKNGETCTGRTIWPIVCANKFVDENTYTFGPMILRKKIYCKSTKNDWKGSHNKIVWLRFAPMSDSSSWQRTLKNSHNFQNQWHVVNTFCHETKKSTDPKGWIRGNTKIGARFGSHNQLPTR